MKQSPLIEKSFTLALKIISLVKILRAEKEYVFADQMLRSGTSIGANIEEASGSESPADFTHKLSIACKEARETLYWIRLLEESGILRKEKLIPIHQDTEEIIRMLVASIKTLRSKS